ncbi:MAG: acyl carrier protein [Bryobacteraceae bacterium]|nr:acyl carrier protein [Bryobacteraceae bacterium]
MSDEILQRVIKVIAETQRISAEGITAESSFEALGIDSLDGINIVFGVENEFSISVPDEAAKSIRSVGDMAAGVERLLAGA